MNPCKCWLYLIALFFLPSIALAKSSPVILSLGISKKKFEWTVPLRSVYKKVISLRFREAEKELEAIRKSDGDNLMILHVENYLDFLRVYINEDEAEFNKLEKNKNKRIDQITREGDPASPYYLYLLADIRLQWALARLKFEQYPTAFLETNKAFKLLTTNSEKFPEFMPNKKDLGLLHAFVGTIPSNYRWAVNWLSSLDGTLEQGKSEILEVVRYARKNDFIYEEEVYVFYTYLLLHLDNNSEDAWSMINSSGLKPMENPMACFIMANLAMRTFRGDEAISILSKRPTGAQYHPFYYLDFMEGVARLQKLDKSAETYLLRFVQNFRGRNFIKEAYQKLAWLKLLSGDQSGYRRNMELCKSKGSSVVGSDRNALDEAKKGEIPVPELLKARLLFDGGHFEEAYQLLGHKRPEDYVSSKNQLELTYRLGRVTQKMKNLEEAKTYYEQTILKGRNQPWYFACRAALELGIIYEEQRNFSSARRSYELCLTMSPEDHQTALHQQAKAGLRRLKN